MKSEISVNPSLLTWAITRAGFGLQDFTAKVPNVQKWIAGEKNPTVKQLEDFSKKVHLPFGYFFLPKPPEEKLPFPYFRTNDPNATSVSINVMDTIRLLQNRQDWLRDYLKENDFEK
jgi:hypothetical protein